jgi:hypothetical protein
MAVRQFIMDLAKCILERKFMKLETNMRQRLMTIKDWVRIAYNRK